VTEQRKIRVAVVFGGRSTEHAVSCIGAGRVLAAVDPDRYEVVPIGITRAGQWVLADKNPARLAIKAGQLPSVESVALPAAGQAQERSDAALDVPGGTAAHGLDTTWRDTPGLIVTGPGQVPQILADAEVVLPLLHGAYGEDGTIQGLLELAGIRYAGAGVLASAASMDKEYTKMIFRSHGLPTGAYVVVRDSDWGPAASPWPGHSAGVQRKRVLDEIADLGWPVFVKPARGGSSIGTSKASDTAELHEAIEAARQHDPKVIVEAAIDGVEVECGVLQGADGGPPDTSVPGQIRVTGGQEFYDFEAKYLDAATDVVIPAPIPHERAGQIRQLAAAAFEAMSCEGLARVDFFYTPDGRVIVNEINTMPGLTPTSAFPLMWQATGLPLPQLVDRILQTALRRRLGLR
jgi:D-alanine--D-alanine ligase